MLLFVVKEKRKQVMDTNGVMKKYKIKIKNPVMGVPISFLDKYCPNQFRILGLAADQRDECEFFIKGTPTYLDEKHKSFVGMVLNHKATYARLLIQKIN